MMKKTGLLAMTTIALLATVPATAQTPTSPPAAERLEWKDAPKSKTAHVRIWDIGRADFRRAVAEGSDDLADRLRGSTPALEANVGYDGGTQEVSSIGTDIPYAA